ncbi:Tfp pilus assembly protein FimT/FimU [Pseudofrancisella aestuarii]|uniref:Tfp pilus assembly protein FimT/FimU n=1 Tax=Pseudofrancisella aestuarii TaxID=2670347 RepID=A0ABV9TDH9_9GAMM|nr:type II secretion system protein [Pseudofrancisella aestuarii]
MKRKSKQKGIALIETLISLVIIMFVSFFAFSLMSNFITNATLQNTQTELLNELDNRVITFDALGTFNENDFIDGRHGVIKFCYSNTSDDSSNNRIYTFTATNTEMNISKDLLAISDSMLPNSTNTQTTTESGVNVCS